MSPARSINSAWSLPSKFVLYAPVAPSIHLLTTSSRCDPNNQNSAFSSSYNIANVACIHSVLQYANLPPLGHSLVAISRLPDQLASLIGFSFQVTRSVIRLLQSCTSLINQPHSLVSAASSWPSCDCWSCRSSIQYRFGCYRSYLSGRSPPQVVRSINSSPSILINQPYSLVPAASSWPSCYCCSYRSLFQSSPLAFS